MKAESQQIPKEEIPEEVKEILEVVASLIAEHLMDQEAGNN